MTILNTNYGKWWASWWWGWSWYVTTSSFWQSWNYYYMFPWSRWNSDCFDKDLCIWSFCFDQYESVVWDEFYNNNKSVTTPAWAFKTDPARCNEDRTDSFITVSREKLAGWTKVWKDVITNWLAAYAGKRDQYPTWCFYANIWLVSTDWTCRCFYHSTADDCWISEGKNNYWVTVYMRWWLFSQYCSGDWLIACEWDRIFVEIWWTWNYCWNNFSSLYLWSLNHVTHDNKNIRQIGNCRWDDLSWDGWGHSVWYLDACRWNSQAYPIQISLE